MQILDFPIGESICLSALKTSGLSYLPLEIGSQSLHDDMPVQV